MAETNPNSPAQPAGSSLPPDQTYTPEFSPEKLDRAVIALPLLQRIGSSPPPPKPTRRKPKLAMAADEQPAVPNPGELIPVIIDLNLRYAKGRPAAATQVEVLLDAAKAAIPNREESAINTVLSRFQEQYVFANLHGDIIQKIAELDTTAATVADPQNPQIRHEDNTKRAIHRIWPDFEVKAFLTKSVSTVKADAAHLSYSAFGNEITWAVMDSGIDREHRHFAANNNIDEGTYHIDLTNSNQAPFQDDFGHGTHVAGIIAGQSIADDAHPIFAVSRQRDEQDHPVMKPTILPAISGMAPRCKLVSMKVLDARGTGQVSALIAAIAHIQEINGYGRDIKIHGVNMSLGYNFDPEWFACGQSPLCVEVDRLVKSGVVVVVAAGNTGYGVTQSAGRGSVASGLALSINDPGNADMAITVGSTHREMPHTYGVSYFSSKGPTGDGRLKPDLLAPGEKIISCAAGKNKAPVGSPQPYEYIEDSGTSMAAPHVSGVIAAFLSIRREYIGRPEAVKELFLSSATDLKRDRYFQGYGLIDLMRAIQSV